MGHVADGKYEEEGKLADEKLGMSSLAAHGDAHIAPFMPQQMQDMGTGTHHAASRLVIVLQDAGVSPGEQSIRDVNRVLHDVTAACTACHGSYRIR